MNQIPREVEGSHPWEVVQQEQREGSRCGQCNEKLVSGNGRDQRTVCRLLFSFLESCGAVSSRPSFPRPHDAFLLLPFLCRACRKYVICLSGRIFA